MISSWPAEKIIAEAGEDRGEDIKEKLESSEVDESEINRSQRILLIAEEYDYEVLATAEWLYGKGVDIGCIRVSLAVDGDSRYLSLNQIFPAPELADQARKRGRVAGVPRRSPSSWEEALADVTNDAVVEFFKRKSNLGLKERLKYKEIDFPPENRIKVYARNDYAAVAQWCGRFPGDVAFWTSKVHPSGGVREGTKVHKSDVLRFRLCTAEDFCAFEEALKSNELLQAKWSSTPHEV